MRNLSLILVIFFSSFPTWASVSLDDSWVRVRIFENLKTISISGQQIEIVQKAESFRNVSASATSYEQLDIDWQKKWNDSFLVAKFLEGKTEMKKNSLFIKGEKMAVGNLPISDFVQIYKGKFGFDVISYVKLRDYLKGVVSSEMPVNWPAETLKAQIVAARSYVLFMAEKRKKMNFDVESSIKDQVYRHSEDPKLEPLLDETANMVLMDGRKHLLKAYYHSECGGQTSSAKKVFGDSQFDAEVRDPYCAGRTWKLKMPKSEGEKIFGSFKSIANTFNPIKRAYSVSVERPNHTVVTFDAQKLRMMIGSTRMKSTWFETRASEKNIEFIGKGYGHGVGLCQWGSRQMGLMKKSFKEILGFYYPGTQITTVVSGLFASK